jgi:transposase
MVGGQLSMEAKVVEIVMGAKEQFAFSILDDYRDGRKSRLEASILLNRSERTIDRMLKKVSDKGLIGLKHGNLGRTPINKSNQATSDQIAELIKSKYFDFNMTHCHEMIIEREDLKISYQSLRRLSHKIGYVKHKKKIRRKNKYHRDRMANEGLLLQMDGSHHDWNGKEKWCLISMIDDATSEIPYAEFFKSEDTLNCLKVLEAVIAVKGIPQAIYVDKAGWFGGTKRQEFSQFTRAAEELGINVIYANSPEAKGRIERAWKTFQDRLIPELRLSGIENMGMANQYLAQHFIPSYWNKRNTVMPQSLKSRYRSIPINMDIAQFCCWKEIRQIRNDLTIHWNNQLFKIDNKTTGPIKGRQIEIRTYWNGDWRAFLGRIPLTLKPIVVPFKRYKSAS